jgi:transcriptional regulator with XRE-family HTH domain
MANSFGDKMKSVRMRNSMTLTQMAAELNLDSGNLSKIENGKRKLDDDRLSLFCAKFSCDFGQMKSEMLSDHFAKEIVVNDLSADILSMVEQKLKSLKAQLR